MEWFVVLHALAGSNQRRMTWFRMAASATGAFGQDIEDFFGQ